MQETNPDNPTVIVMDIPDSLETIVIKWRNAMGLQYGYNLSVKNLKAAVAADDALPVVDASTSL